MPSSKLTIKFNDMTDNSLVDGFNKVTLGSQPTSDAFVVNSYGGYSKKGYAPYNPKKKNQDVLVMAEDPRTRSLLLSVMDGSVLSMLSTADYLIYKRAQFFYRNSYPYNCRRLGQQSEAYMCMYRFFH